MDPVYKFTDGVNEAFLKKNLSFQEHNISIWIFISLTCCMHDMVIFRFMTPGS